MCNERSWKFADEAHKVTVKNRETVLRLSKLKAKNEVALRLKEKDL